MLIGLMGINGRFFSKEEEGDVSSAYGANKDPNIVLRFVQALRFHKSWNKTDTSTFSKFFIFINIVELKNLVLNTAFLLEKYSNKEGIL